MEVQFKPYALIDETAWENIRSGIGARQTWFFSLSFRVAGRNLRYIFFFGKHFWTSEDDAGDRSEPRVSLLISESLEHADARRLNDLPGCPLELREIFAIESDLVAMKSTGDGGETDRIRYDRSSTGIRLAQEFIEQVLLHRIY